MNSHALAVLEFPQVLDLVAGRASSPLGAARVRTFLPDTDRAAIVREHALVAAARAAIAGSDGWRPEAVPDVTAALARLRAEGSVLSAEELKGISVLLRSSRLTRDALSAREGARGLSATAASLITAKQEESSIASAIGDDFEVLDSASGTLRRLRRERTSSQSELVQLLEKMLARLDDKVRVPDMSVTMRNGRYVIPVRREGRGSVGGIVHDESSTRGTLFMEPPAAVELGNRIRELESEEREEIERILAALSDEVRPLRDGIAASLEALIVLDTLYARARFAEEFACVPAALAPASAGFAICAGRHPLLAARSGAVVPFDLVMEPGERTLLLSGPNTGGKTVLLKALGLLSAMAQAGIPPTVGDESTIPLFDDCFADIGDEQSIEASLSTFSAHLRNLGEILGGATGDSLALIDELGSGTDPAEGAALGAAVLEELTARGTRTVATTHLGALKLLATERVGVVNASLQFDEKRLEPTYRLLKGVPGRSYGLGIARRLRLPEDVLARAEARMSGGERDLEALLADLERRSAELEERERDAAISHENAQARIANVTAREKAAREAERTLEKRAREESRAMLLAARRDVERVVRELRESGANEEAARAARRHIEELAGAQAAAITEMEREPAAEAEVESADVAGVALAPGDAVAVETLAGRVGTVVSLRDEEAVVALGSMKLRVPARTLRRTARATAPAAAESGVPLYGSLPDETPNTEVDLRGMRVDEMERALTAALDAAVRSDLKQLRVIHGKGTGALRERAGELLKGDARVASFRLGAWNEGGAGVTVAELPMITDETVERVREAADIAQVIGEHVKLKKVGNSWRGPCPFHQGTHPNFSVVPSKGLYICFVCGEKGDVFTFLQKRMGIDFPTAVKQVADRVGIIVEEVQRRREGTDTRQPYWDANAAVADYFRTQLWDEKEGEEARNYLALRRVHRDVADRFGLGCAPRDPAAMRGHLNKIGMNDELLLEAGLLVRREESGELRPRFRSRLMFPIQDAASNYVGFGGRLLGPGEPKYLNSSESPVYSKSKLLYGLHMAKHAIRKDDHVLVVEGYFDVVRLVSAGFDWVVAPLGTALTDEQAALLRRYTKNAFLLYDSDRAGLKATFRSGDQLLRQGMSVQVVTLPDGEDPDSFVDKHGGNALEEQLKHAINVFERKVQLLQRAGSFTDLTRKRRALDRLLPSIRAASDPLTRDIYLARASEVAGVAKDILAHEADQLPASSFTRGSSSSRGEAAAAPPRSFVRPRAAARTSRTMPAAERGLVWLLLQDRTQVEPAGEQVGPEDLTDPALREIMQALIAADPSKASGELAAELPEESAAVALELLGEPLEDGFDAGAHLAACVAALRAAVIQRRLGDIDGEIPIATSEEKDALFVEKQRLHLEERALGVRRYKSFVR